MYVNLDSEGEEVVYQIHLSLNPQISFWVD